MREGGSTIERGSLLRVEVLQRAEYFRGGSTSERGVLEGGGTQSPLFSLLVNKPLLFAMLKSKLC